MTDTKQLREIIKEKGIKLKYIADKLGITPYCLQQKLNNVSEFKSSEIQELCTILNIDDLKLKDSIFFAAKVD